MLKINTLRAYDYKNKISKFYEIQKKKKRIVMGVVVLREREDNELTLPLSVSD